MPAEALEEIRLLSNLESSRHKLLQIVLFGQPELDQRLGENAMRQLNDRITHNFRLAPLRPSGRRRVPDVPAARCRLPRPGPVQPTGDPADQQGLRRADPRINILADKALLAAFSEGVHQVGGGRSGGDPRCAVQTHRIYGDYASREQANAALATLGEISPSSRPYVRPVARLRSARLSEGSESKALRQ
jgi:hypothetical protein